MAGIRAWLAAAVVCGLFVPGAAWAASPGDEVAFTIPDSDRGDGYTISVEDNEVAKGVDDTADPGISGEFAMPDLGSRAREVAVVIVVERAADGSSRSYESKVDYTPAEAAESQPASRPAPPRPPAPVPRAPAATPHQPVIVAPAASPAPAISDPATLVEPPGGRVLRMPERILHGLSGQAVPLRHRGTPAARRRPRRHARRANRIRAGSDPSPPRVRSLSAPRDTRTNLSDDRFPGLGYSVAWKLLAAVVAAGLLMPLLAGARAQTRRRPATR